MRVLAFAALILLTGCAVVTANVIQVSLTDGTPAAGATAALPPNTSSEDVAENDAPADKVSERVVYLLGTRTSVTQATSQGADISAAQNPCNAWMTLLDPERRYKDCRVISTAVNRLLRYVRRQLDSSRMYLWLRGHQIEPKDFVNFVIGQLYQAVNIPVSGNDDSWMDTESSSSDSTSSAQGISQQMSSTPLSVSPDQTVADSSTQSPPVQVTGP
ncbi:hypothetical protein AAHC03_013082 [Spirometra sp. Aus1]|nr:unnamed protein product [Spirometra erinaceieuropaei]